MINIVHVKQNKARPLSSDLALEIGDSILISGKEEAVPFVGSRKNQKLHILLISPIGTIIDSDQVRLEETGLRKIYSFPITPDLYSGTYFLQIEGDYKLREKVNIRTNKHLIYRWILFYGVQLKNPNNFPLNNFVLDVMIPPSISPIQQVLNAESNHKPTKLITDDDGNRWLRFYFHQINPREKITIAYKADIVTRLVAYDITRLRGEEQNIETLYPQVFKKYTKSEPFLESSNDSIANIAKKYLSHSPLSKVLAFLKYVKENLVYVPQDGDYGATYAIENKLGDCTEFSSLFVSLCRAGNVPARLTTSIILSEYEGWVHHSQAEFFANGVWFPIDPTLQHDFRYLYRNPSCIILQRGNTLGDSNIREVSYSYDDINQHEISMHAHKAVKWDKGLAEGKKRTSNENYRKTKGTMFENLNWKFSLPSLDLDKHDKTIEIRVTTSNTAPIHKPFSIPVHLYNRSDEGIIGTLRVSFTRGGIYTNHLYPMLLEANSHEPKMVEIPATNFLGPTFIELIFQDDNGNKIGYEQKKINFH